MFQIKANFIGNFKLGDNINHNLDILNYCYKRLSDTEDSDSWLLRKPIITTLGAICEAILYDLHLRMRTYTNEGVRGVTQSVLDYVRGKKIDRFDLYISCAKKHTLLGPQNDDIYINLDELRKLRNRVHIQNEKNDFEPNESQAFSCKKLKSSEQTLEKLLKIMSAEHSRPAGATGHVNDFQLPWDEHFED